MQTVHSISAGLLIGKSNQIFLFNQKTKNIILNLNKNKVAGTFGQTTLFFQKNKK